MEDTRIETLEKLIKFLEENNIDLLSCSCCDGISIVIDGVDISTMCICNKQDMYDLLNKLKKGK
jgi:hypothetical protein